MEILNLTLTNYRNFSNKKIVFDQDLTALIGPNGIGKSNILEAISLVCGVKASGVESDLDLVKFGKSEAKIEAMVVSKDETLTLTINFQVIDERIIHKSFMVDGLKRSFAKFLEILSIVVFHPPDLDLVSGSPSLRRHHLDSLLSASDRDYWRNISAYNKVVARRNRILHRIREGQSKPLELNFWDERILEHGKFVSKKREEFISFLNFVEHGEELGEIGDLSFELKQSLVSVEKLANNRERDIAAGITLSGPHRDDFRFIFKGRDLEYIGSRGEQRMAILALKLSELEYLRVQKGSRPILGLDDIFSELDWEHRATVLSVIGNQQTIITAAEKESVPKELLKKAKVIDL